MMINEQAVIGIALVAGSVLMISIALLILIELISKRCVERQREELRETLAEMAREQNISEGEAARRKMRGQ